MVTNFLERRGWVRTREDQYRFVKLSYLRLIENHSLAPSVRRVHCSSITITRAAIVAKSLWPSLCDQLQFEYISGHHRVWQTAILSILPMVRERLQSVATREANIA